MNLTDLNKILGEHKIWVESYRESGSRANLRGANLSDADLSGADLSDAQPERCRPA
ncbi:pentapeptide repeat-containing protein [Yersinia enterocolitica]|uniref:pentapeptide repeat-containing protein n=1 Tax=Yersinia enterocolitica TaxID=630 RepID=UPI001E531B63|nr:pentapeptide repeat-containing protein [Yersinia enterocolitica]